MEKVYVAILGLGTVGQGVAMMLLDNAQNWARRTGSEIIIKKTLERHPEKKLDVDLKAHGVIRTSDWEEIVKDPDISVVIETIGGMEPCKTYITQALKAGKNVVTANKELLANSWEELFAAAIENERDLYFEASVCGAVPIISALRQNLSGAVIESIVGIVNGSTNYMLTRMKNEGLGYEDILDDAKKLGYLEADPTADVEGLDAARKAAILATIAFKNLVTYEDVYKEGITKISSEDIDFAEKLGYAIKLLAVIKDTEEGIETRVHPALIPLEHQLANVSDTFNAVFLSGSGFEETMLYGRGAGRMQTASAVVGDLVEIVRNINFGCNGRLNQLWPKCKKIVPIEDVVTRFFIRLVLEDKPGTMAELARAMADHGISMDSVLQKEMENSQAEVVLITHPVPEKCLRNAVKDLEKLEAIKEVKSVLRVEGVKDV